MGGVAVECRDWLEGIGGLAPGSVDLVYVDPPFNTGQRRVGRGGAAYEDSWVSLEAWLAWLRERLEATRRALKDTGSILLHVDWRTSHRARCVLDDVFGADRFVNHIVWAYGLGGSSARRFARKHDDILFYCVDPGRYWFEPPRVAATSARMKGQMKKATDVVWGEGGETERRSGDRAARSTTDALAMMRLGEGGEGSSPSPLPSPRAEPRGEGGDVLDVPSINNMARERTGYPTQKPVALLEMLVRACCPAAGLVVDPCCGSGTTLEAAARSGRRAIGFDLSAAAVEVCRRRLGMWLESAGAGGATPGDLEASPPAGTAPYDATTRCPDA